MWATHGIRQRRIVIDPRCRPGKSPGDIEQIVENGAFKRFDVCRPVRSSSTMICSCSYVLTRCPSCAVGIAPLPNHDDAIASAERRASSMRN